LTVSETGQSPGAAPAVSVILPTYERRELVRRAIASVMAQTYRDFELIVVDDGSTDGTREALASVSEKLRYRWQPNRGVAAARNAGLRMARGSIVAFIDSDNRWLPDHLAVVTEVLAGQPTAVAVSTCPGNLIRGRERPVDARLVDYRPRHIGGPFVPGFITGVAARRQALIAVAGFDQRLKAGEVSDLWLRLATEGPFAMVRRRTIVQQMTAGSLKDRARRNGYYLASAELRAQNLISAAERLPAPERSQFRGEATGLGHLYLALRALDRGDGTVVARELEMACRLLPLSTRVWLFESRLTANPPRMHDRRERLGMLRMLATHWPEKDAPTPRYLRAWAIAVALRLGEPGEAGRLLAGWRLRGTLRFALEIAPFLWLWARRLLQQRRHTGQEAIVLRRGDSGASPVGPQR
jgi:glycosyl transferase family 2